MRWLGSQGAFIEKVTEDSKGKDSYSQAIACQTRISAGKFCEDLVVVFWGLLGFVEWRQVRPQTLSSDGTTNLRVSYYS